MSPELAGGFLKHWTTREAPSYPTFISQTPKNVNILFLNYICRYVCIYEYIFYICITYNSSFFGGREFLKIKLVGCQRSDFRLHDLRLPPQYFFLFPHLSYLCVLSYCLLIFNMIFINSIISSGFKDIKLGNSLVVQWLGLHAFTAVGPCSICSRGTKILQAAQCGQEKKKKKI